MAQRPSDSLARRTLHAVKLYREGLAATIICSGGLGTHPPTEAHTLHTVRENVLVEMLVEGMLGYVALALELGKELAGT